MVKEAESHAEEDKARREPIELRNEAESMVYQAETERWPTMARRSTAT